MEYTENRVFDGFDIGYADDALSPSDALVVGRQNPCGAKIVATLWPSLHRGEG